MVLFYSLVLQDIQYCGTSLEPPLQFIYMDIYMYEFIKNIWIHEEGIEIIE